MKRRYLNITFRRQAGIACVTAVACLSAPAQPASPQSGSKTTAAAATAAAQHRDLVTQGQDLDILGRVRACEKHQPAQHTNEHQVNESEGHFSDHAGLRRPSDDEVGQPQRR